MPEQPLSILVLAESEKAAALDRRALRDAGYTNVRVEPSGIEAARLLAGLTSSGVAPDIVVCQGELADMDGEQFCAIIRQHPSLLGFPILLILANEEEAQQLRALGCGASALIGRPYSVDILKKQIAQFAGAVAAQRNLRNAAKKADTHSFEEALATYGVLLRSERQPQDFFKAGMKCLDDGCWSTAIIAFERTLRDAQVKAEAELGIAAAYKGKGDMTRFKAWLARASESFVQARKWDRARRAYARLLQHDQSARNPFLAEAHRLIRQNQYEEAADVLGQGLSVLSKRKVGDRLARICMAAEEPEKMFSVLEKALQDTNKLQAEYLGKEIRESLDVMEEQKRERQKRQAAERKWELAKNLGALPYQRAAANENGNVVAPQKPAVEKQSVRQATPELREEKVIEGLMDDGEWVEGEEEAIAAFGAEDYGKKRGWNELFSVIKLTWKLSRKAEKKS